MPEHTDKEMPTIVCLCGSTRFMDAFFEVGWQETLAGKIVLSVGVCKHTECMDGGGHGAEFLGPEVVTALDELHFRKIDLADEVLILNVGGYIGESTRNELEYAQKMGKPIRYLETPMLPNWLLIVLLLAPWVGLGVLWRKVRRESRRMWNPSWGENGCLWRAIDATRQRLNGHARHITHINTRVERLEGADTDEPTASTDPQRATGPGEEVLHEEDPAGPDLDVVREEDQHENDGGKNRPERAAESPGSRDGGRQR